MRSRFRLGKPIVAKCKHTRGGGGGGRSWPLAPAITLVVAF